MSAILTAQDVGHRFESGRRTVQVFDSVSFEVAAGEVVAVTGESGCGKTTLLLNCGAMMRPSRGKVTICNEDVYKLPAIERARFRAHKIGYMFQTLELIPYLNLTENVAVVQGVDTRQAQKSLAKLGLQERLDHKPRRLSHGQRQRASLARAIVHRPGLVVADEPTGNLDEVNSRIVYETLQAIAKENGAAVLIATHDQLIHEFATAIYQLKAGKLTRI